MFLAFGYGLFARADTIRTSFSGTSKDQLIYDLLTLALSHSKNHYTLSSAPKDLSTGRKTEQVIDKKMEVFWAGMSPELERSVRPIRIPIFKGLLGHRIFVIKKGTAEKYHHIETLEQLTLLRAGQGQFWGDTKILEAAGIPVTKASQGENLWAMLNENRFDYMALALHEPWTEISKRQHLQVEVEPSLLLVYPFAMYFYVHKENDQLHRDIHKGMHEALMNGSYDELLFGSPLINDALKKAQVHSRRIIRIPNPTLHPDTPVDRTQYWFDPLKQYNIPTT